MKRPPRPAASSARAKAVLAWNEATGAFRSGQLPTDAGFTYWLIKFDGVSNNRDEELADPQGFGLVEYAFSRMAAPLPRYRIPGQSQAHQRQGSGPGMCPTSLRARMTDAD